MTINPHVIIHPTASLQISTYLQAAMLRAVLPAHRSDVVQAIGKMPVLKEPQKLGKVLAKLLGPFRTQAAGGFQIAHPVSQESVENQLLNELSEFDGLVCGIESSTSTVIQGKKQKRPWILSEAAIVYPQPASPPSVLSIAQTIRTTHTKGTVHRYTPADRPDLCMGHVDSGTSDPEKFPYNRSFFLEVMRGRFDGCALDAKTDISFWDVNFDCTDRVNQKLGLPSTIEMLLDFTKENSVQFIIPAVRVRKIRIEGLPFANNQLHKGGIEQIAESMIATCPRGMKIEALDEDGLYVLSEGTIQLLQLNRDAALVHSVECMAWTQYESFSSEILLDHKPIRVALDGQSYSFHNFMDFKGDIGIMDVCWYDRDKLAKEERDFIAFLQSL